jgi:hypothetical protein
MKIRTVEAPAPMSLKAIMTLRLCRSTRAPAKGDMSRSGVMKATWTSASAVALPVS